MQALHTSLVVCLWAVLSVGVSACQFADQSVAMADPRTTFDGLESGMPEGGDLADAQAGQVVGEASLPDADRSPGIDGSTEFCPRGVVEGDYIIEDAADVARIEGCTDIAGDLVVLSNDLGSLSLPALRAVEAELSVKAKGMVSLKLPSLSRAGFLRVTDTDALTEITLPLLSVVDREMAVQSNASLAAIDLPSLSEVGSDLSVSNEGANLMIRDNLALVNISLPALVNVGNTIEGGVFELSSSKVQSLSLPTIWMTGGLILRENAELTSVAAPGLEVVGDDGLWVTDNSSLASMTLTKLVTVYTSFMVQNNPTLPTAQAQGIWEQLADPPATVIDGNLP